MKYVLMFCADGDDVQRFATMSDADRAAQFEKVGAWFAENQARIIGGRQLAAPPTHVRVAGHAESRAPLIPWEERAGRGPCRLAAG